MGITLIILISWSTMTEDSLLSSTASLASISKAAFRGRFGASGSGKYSSLLDFHGLL